MQTEQQVSIGRKIAETIAGVILSLRRPPERIVPVRVRYVRQPRR